MSHSGEEPLINAVKHDSGAISLRDLSNLIQKGVFRGKVGGWVSKVAMASHSRVNRSVNRDRSKSSKLQNRQTSFWEVAIASRVTWWSYFSPGSACSPLTPIFHTKWVLYGSRARLSGLTPGYTNLWCVLLTLQHSLSHVGRSVGPWEIFFAR